MIRFKVKRDSHDRIISFSLSGHADAGPHGYDIVCAGVSAVTFGAVNAIESLCDVELIIDMEDEGGYLSCTVPARLEQRTDENVQLLLRGMEVSISSIAEEYGNHIQITHT
ncbi:ribosomal-processing cysteine protease Prp [Alkalihalobacillus sp. CinArs1]|uniref:ribosomal-processing cysteine protease Prp n=1 Tax=Alkalihalobacillus sp. CinArs1 TaxID=2995314 RepID=UPI0022DE7A07|nr:ribosomal-processing cysteine protease Prp [Alkalihalobacillus sp. CinArs1]